MLQRSRPLLSAVASNPLSLTVPKLRRQHRGALRRGRTLQEQAYFTESAAGQWGGTVGDELSLCFSPSAAAG